MSGAAIPTAAGRPSREAWFVLGVVGVGTCLNALAGSSTNLALAGIGREFGVSVDATGWVVESFLLTVTTLLPLAGRAGDQFGHRKVYLVGFGLFSLMSLVAALSPSFVWLVASRALQGIGAALVMASGPALLTTSFPPSFRGRALGLLGTATYVGLSVGPPVGGLLITRFGWRAVFFLNVPSGVILLALGLLYLPRTPGRGPLPSDRGGAATLLLGLPLLLIAIAEGSRWGWLSLETIACLLVALGLLAAFVVIEARHSSPLLDLRLFASRVFAGASASAVLNYVTLFVPMILIPYYLLEARGLAPAAAGVVLMAQPVLMAVTAGPAGWLADRIGARPMAVGGMALLAAGVGGLASIGAATPLWLVATWLGIMGAGTGIFISPNSSALMGAAPRTQQGVAAAVLAVARNFGMMMGVAAAMVIFHAGGGQTGETWGPEDVSALRTALLVAAGLAVLGAIVAASAVERRRPAGEGG